MERVEACWKEDDRPDLDPRMKWEMRWGKVRVILKKKKVCLEEEKKEQGDLVKTLNELRMELAANKDPRVALAVAILEMEIGAQELKDIKSWRKRGIVKWLTLVEAPSKCFFI